LTGQGHFIQIESIFEDKNGFFQLENEFLSFWLTN